MSLKTMSAVKIISEFSTIEKFDMISFVEDKKDVECLVIKNNEIKKKINKIFLGENPEITIQEFEFLLKCEDYSSIFTLMACSGTRHFISVFFKNLLENDVENKYKIMENFLKKNRLDMSINSGEKILELLELCIKKDDLEMFKIVSVNVEIDAVITNKYIEKIKTINNSVSKMICNSFND